EVVARGAHVDLELRVRFQRSLESLEGLRIRKARGDRGTAAAAAVGVGDDVGVAPDLGLHGIARGEDADDRPGLAAQADLAARSQAAELARRPAPDDELAQARLEAPAFDDLDLRTHREGLVVDAAQLHAAFLVRPAVHLRQV